MWHVACVVCVVLVCVWYVLLCVYGVYACGVWLCVECVGYVLCVVCGMYVVSVVIVWCMCISCVLHVEGELDDFWGSGFEAVGGAERVS